MQALISSKCLERRVTSTPTIRVKANSPLASLKNKDFVYVHVEAPDEAAHAGLLQEKIGAIESFDKEVVGTIC